jgi:hypothetical protein
MRNLRSNENFAHFFQKCRKEVMVRLIQIQTFIILY